jgi:alpha-glucosidase
VAPWLPVGADHAARAVDVQEGDPDSMLAVTRQIVRLRKLYPALRLGAIDVVTADDALLVLDRRVPGQVLRCLFNLGQVPLPTGLDADWRVVFATGGADLATLPPLSGLVVEAL